MTSQAEIRAKIARACRGLLDVYEREPAIFRRTLPLLTPENIETLRKLATWDVEDPDHGDDP